MSAEPPLPDQPPRPGEPLPEMRPLAMSLLVVAAGDARTMQRPLNIADNAALRYALELAGSAPDLARRAAGGERSFGGWLAADVRTDDFFVFCGRLVDALDRRVRGRHGVLRRSNADEPTSYDHATFLALGQILCRAAGVRRAKFPAIETCFHNISAAPPRSLQRALLVNYLGNVLQDYFDASRIRAEFVSLPKGTEDTLRSEEATALANAVFQLLDRNSEAINTPAEARAVQRELRRVIGSVWLAEGAL